MVLEGEGERDGSANGVQKIDGSKGSGILDIGRIKCDWSRIDHKLDFRKERGHLVEIEGRWAGAGKASAQMVF